MSGQSRRSELSCGILTGIILTGLKTAQYRAEEIKAFLNKSPVLVSVRGYDCNLSFEPMTEIIHNIGLNFTLSDMSHAYL